MLSCFRTYVPFPLYGPVFTAGFARSTGAYQRKSWPLGILRDHPLAGASVGWREYRCFLCQKSPSFAKTSNGWGDPTSPMQLESRMRNERRTSGSGRASPKTALGNRSMASGRLLYLYLIPLSNTEPGT